MKSRKIDSKHYSVGPTVLVEDATLIHATINISFVNIVNQTLVTKESSLQEIHSNWWLVKRKGNCNTIGTEFQCVVGGGGSNSLRDRN